MTKLSRPAELLRDLIKCPSVTPEEGGALTYLQERLEALGFQTIIKTFSAPNTPDVQNLYARLGEAAPNLCFAGHTDVVPVGDEKAWTKDPFAGAIKGTDMIGRGAVDMKGGIACFLAAVEAHLAAGKPVPGSISFLITGDEEGPAINGTKAILDWLIEQGEGIEACIVGEPTNAETLGDTIKIGRRGSVSGTITVNGVQGHAAYPHLADNPVRGMTMLIDALMAEPFDLGTDEFQPTNLEVTSVDVDNPSYNVIAAKAEAKFNIRFNDMWSAETIQKEVDNRLKIAAKSKRLRWPLKDGARDAVSYQLEWVDRPSPVFLTKDDALIASLSHAVKTETNRQPALTTGGGTSDARFIKDVCPVVEFGLVGQTMHQVDERVALSDLDRLTAIYERFLETFFDRAK